MDYKKSVKIGFVWIVLCFIGLSLVPLSTAGDNGDAYLDFKWYPTDKISQSHIAQSGYEYAVVTIYIKNEGEKSVSTAPYDWNFIADGIKYSPDSATYDDSINPQSVDVMKGGEAETTLVFLVKGQPKTGTLHYSELFGPSLKRINHYHNNTN